MNFVLFKAIKCFLLMNRKWFHFIMPNMATEFLKFRFSKKDTRFDLAHQILWPSKKTWALKIDSPYCVVAKSWTTVVSGHVMSCRELIHCVSDTYPAGDILLCNKVQKRTSLYLACTRVGKVLELHGSNHQWKICFH